VNRFDFHYGEVGWESDRRFAASTPRCRQDCFGEGTLTEDREVRIAIDDSFTQPVCNYSVGFLRFEQEAKKETAKPAGTGTFVKLGKVYGILTAGHVLKPIGSKEVVGLVRFPGVKPALQNFRLDLDHTERIVTWNGKECDAPDIPFLKIPELDGRNLEAAGAVFYQSRSGASVRGQ
jgi:hypothetical protein